MPPCLGLLYPRVSCLLSCIWESTAPRSCAAWDDNNKDNVCAPTIPAGLKRPPPSKTISLITWFEVSLNTCVLDYNTITVYCIIINLFSYVLKMFCFVFVRCLCKAINLISKCTA